MTKQDLREPFVLRPNIYTLTALPVRWNWCRLGEVCTTAAGLIRRLGGSFEPTPEQFVQAFALAARPTNWSQAAVAKVSPRRIFRYATADGRSLGVAQGLVPEESGPRGTPAFRIELGCPYAADLFVPEGWVIDVMNMVRLGAIDVRFAARVDGKRWLFCTTFDGGSCSFDEKGRLRGVSDLAWSSPPSRA